MDDLLGWQSTRWGMTAAEIIAAVGKDVVHRGDRTKYSDVYSELFIPRAPIGSFDYRIEFQMRVGTDVLERVSLFHDDLALAHPARAFDATKRLLAERFGPGRRVGTSDDWEWPFTTTVISLSLIYFPESLSRVVVQFRPATTNGMREIAAF